MHKRTPRCWCREAQFLPLSAKCKQHYIQSGSDVQSASVNIHKSKHSPQSFLCECVKKSGDLCDQCSRARWWWDGLFTVVIVPEATITFCAAARAAARRLSRDCCFPRLQYYTLIDFASGARDAFLPARRAKLINLCCSRVELKWFLPVYKLIFHAHPREINDRYKRELLLFFPGFN